MKRFGVTHQSFKPLIVWNIPSWVNILLAEKLVGWFAQAEAENFPRVSFK